MNNQQIKDIIASGSLVSIKREGIKPFMDWYSKQSYNVKEVREVMDKIAQDISAGKLDIFGDFDDFSIVSKIMFNDDVMNVDEAIFFNETLGFYKSGYEETEFRRIEREFKAKAKTFLLNMGKFNIKLNEIDIYYVMEAPVNDLRVKATYVLFYALLEQIMLFDKENPGYIVVENIDYYELEDDYPLDEKLKGDKRRNKMNTNARKVTNEVINAVEDGFLDWEAVARAALNYLSEDDVEDMAEINDWNIWFEDEEEDEEDEDVCPDCGKEFGKDGRCYNQDCVAYDPTSQYFDDEEDTIMKRLTASEKQKIDEISERYVTSSPISGKWETEAIHERDAIAKELRLTKEEANEVMVEYLGFDIDNLESEELTEKKVEKKITTEEVINTAKKYGLTVTKEALKDLEGNVATLNYLIENEEFDAYEDPWKDNDKQILLEIDDMLDDLEDDGEILNMAYPDSNQILLKAVDAVKNGTDRVYEYEPRIKEVFDIVKETYNLAKEGFRQFDYNPEEIDGYAYNKYFSEEEQFYESLKRLGIIVEDLIKNNNLNPDIPIIHHYFNDMWNILQGVGTYLHYNYPYRIIE